MYFLLSAHGSSHQKASISFTRNSHKTRSLIIEPLSSDFLLAFDCVFQGTDAASVASGDLLSGGDASVASGGAFESEEEDSESFEGSFLPVSNETQELTEQLQGRSSKSSRPKKKQKDRSRGRSEHTIYSAVPAGVLTDRSSQFHGQTRPD